MGEILQQRTGVDIAHAQLQAVRLYANAATPRRRRVLAALGGRSTGLAAGRRQRGYRRGRGQRQVPLDTDAAAAAHVRVQCLHLQQERKPQKQLDGR